MTSPFVKYVKSFRCAALIASLAGGAALAAQAPQPPQEPAGGWAFEVASIKPNNSGDGRVMMQMQPGQLRATNVTLRLLIRQAYSLQEFQISGGPSWMASDHFDLIAKMPEGFQPTPGPPPAAGGPPTPMQQMMRRLLAERFKFAAHNETKDAPIYALIVARSDGKLGPQIKKSETDCAAVMAAARGRGPAPCRRLPARRRPWRQHSLRDSHRSGHAGDGRYAAGKLRAVRSACSPAASCSIAPGSPATTTST